MFCCLWTERKEIEERRKKQEEEQKEKEEYVFKDDDISTRWILNVFEQKGLSVPPPSIRFARIASMSKEEVMGFMAKFYESKKKGDVNIEDMTNEDEQPMEKVKKAEEIGEPKEVVSYENEMKALNILVKKSQLMYDFFTEKLELCVDVHINGKVVNEVGFDEAAKDKEKKEEEELYGNDDNEDNKDGKGKKDGKEEKIDAKNFDAKVVMDKLRAMGLHHVALSFELLNIERQHYGDIVRVMKEGVDIVEKRLNKVLNGVDDTSDKTAVDV